MATDLTESAAFQRLAHYVRSSMAGNDASHDFEHVKRVIDLTMALAEQVCGAVSVRSCARLLLVAGERKSSVGEPPYASCRMLTNKGIGSSAAGAAADSADGGASAAAGDGELRRALQLAEQEELLTSADLAEVEYIVKNIGFKAEISARDRGEALNITPPFACVQDADRLDAIGAVGIARCFTFGGKKLRPLYDAERRAPPDEVERVGVEASAYADAQREQNTLDHFYEKLLTLEAMMKTTAGQKMARKRTETMQRFLDDFWEEINVGSRILRC
eukprot:scaffold5937_cov275-Pinguiococcus_pyrenoidosus.AAC.15